MIIYLIISLYFDFHMDFSSRFAIAKLRMLSEMAKFFFDISEMK